MSHERGRSPREVKITSAAEFVRRVEAGESSADASLATGANPASSEVRMAKELAAAKAKAFYIKDTQERKEFVIGSMLAIMATETDAKNVIAAARMLAGDPDLGFNQQPTVAISFSQEVLELPGVPRWKSSGELAAAEVIDVTPVKELEEKKAL